MSKTTNNNKLKIAAITLSSLTLTAFSGTNDLMKKKKLLFHKLYFVYCLPARFQCTTGVNEEIEYKTNRQTNT